MIFASIHGTGESDIYTANGYELIRRVLGMGIERVVVIAHGVKVHEITAQDGLAKAMDWAREHSRLSQPIVETTLPGWDANGSPQR